MEDRTRERIALVVFVLLVVFAGVVLTSYFSTGRSWTVAATMVDDRVGQMEGYTAIVYSGVVQPKKASENPEKTSTQDDAQVPHESVAEEIGLTSASDRVSVAELISLNFLSISPLVNKKEHEGVFVSDVRSSYEIKGADVLTLDLSDPSRYEKPFVLNAGEKKIGIFSVHSYASKAFLRSVMAYFEQEEADFVVCITPRTALLANDEGIDTIIVLSADEGADRRDKSKDSSFIVTSPEVGEVGILLLSSNNVPSTRTITTLA